MGEVETGAGRRAKWLVGKVWLSTERLPNRQAPTQFTPKMIIPCDLQLPATFVEIGWRGEDTSHSFLKKSTELPGTGTGENRTL